MHASRLEVLENRALLSTLPPGFIEETIPGLVQYTTGMAIAPDGRVFVCEQGGRVRIIEDDVLLAQPLLTVAVDTLEERGLANIAVDPEFDINGYVYVWYTTPTNTGGQNVNRLERYTVTGNVANPASALTLFETEPLLIPIHNAGAMAFGPDGMLYFTHGHGWYGQEPQSLNSTMGKILRIAPDGTIPTDNPFYAVTSGRNRAIWARGFRNPYTIAFEPQTQALFANDVGGSSWEEINVVPAGGNCGWPLKEGVANDPAFIDPVYAYDHTEGSAIIGAVFYTPEHSSFPPEYAGKFFFGDFTGQWIRVMDPQTHVVTPFASDLSNYRTAMALSPDGDLYFTVRDAPGEQSQVHRIRYTGSLAPTIAQGPVSQTAAAGETVSFSVDASGTGPFTYRWFKDNQELANTNSATLELPNVSSLDVGDYHVEVSSSYGIALSAPATLAVVNGVRPQIDITLPLAGGTFRAGDVIAFQSIATDLEDGVLPPSSVQWQVEFGHRTHRHPFVPSTTGLSGNFQVSDAGEPDHEVYYLITVEATDSSGLKTIATRRIDPELSQVTLTSNIPGITLQLDGQPHQAPYTFTGVELLKRLISAPAVQEVNGQTYLFTGWSHGGEATQELITPILDTTFTALYRKVSPVYLSDLPTTFESNGRGPVERDSNNGGIPAGDGGILSINGKTYAKGLGTYAPAEMRFDLNGEYTRFVVSLGIDDAAGDQGSVYYEVWLDGVRAYRSPVMRGMTAAIELNLPVAGADELKLVVEDEASRGNDLANFANAFLVPKPRVLDVREVFDGAAFAINIELSDDIAQAITAADLVLEDLDSAAVLPLTPANLQYDPVGNELQIVFPTNPQTLLPDGDYRLTLNKPGFIDYDGQTLALFGERDFFVLQSDATRDRFVDMLDFNVLAGQFGQMSRVFSQGDFSYDGSVDSVDFALLISRFGKRVIAPASRLFAAMETDDELTDLLV
jgi:glucose/arabinose dehydrogenase